MLQMPMIGSLNTMLKMQKMDLLWQKRKENPNLPKGQEEDRQITRLKAQAEDVRKGNVIQSIDGKLKAGQKLSDEEMEYLRLNNPKLYEEAKKVAMEREQYRKALENCRTKEDVERLNSQRMQRFLGETQVIRSNPNIPMGKKQELMDQILRRMMGVKSEHAIFTQKPEYADLPREAELEEGKKAKKKVSMEDVKEELERPPEGPEESDAARPSDAAERPTDDKPSGDEPTEESLAEGMPARPAGKGPETAKPVYAKYAAGPKAAGAKRPAAPAAPSVSPAPLAPSAPSPPSTPSIPAVRISARA